MVTKFLKLRFDFLFFCLLVFLLPFEKKHVFLPNFTNLSTDYSPWLSIEIYLTDIIFLFLLIFWFIHKIFTGKNLLERKSVLRGQSIKKEGDFSTTKIFRAGLILVFLLFCAQIFVVDNLGINYGKGYHLLKFIEFLFLFYYTIKNIDNFVKLLFIVGVFILSTVFQATLGMLQYFFQHSVGLKIFGEVDLSPQIPNVAKIVVDGEKIIRAYGTLPHANIFGGYLFVGLVFCLMLFLLSLYFFSQNKTKNKIVPRGTFFDEVQVCGSAQLTTYSQTKLQLINFLYHQELNILAVLLFIFFYLFLGLILSFSRSAWLAFLFVFIFLIIIFRHLLINFCRHNRDKISLILLILFFVIILWIIFLPEIRGKTFQFDQYGDKAMTARVEYAKIALKMVKSSPFLGIGYGNFVSRLPEFNQNLLSWWQFQPVHNIYLLILAETGIFGFLIFLIFFGYFIYFKIKSLKKINNFPQKIVAYCLFLSFCGLLVIGFFDHYLWDIQQGSLLFWLVLGLSLCKGAKF